MIRLSELPKHKQDEIRAKRTTTSGGGWGNTGDLKDGEFVLMNIIRMVFVLALAWITFLAALMFLS